MRMAAPRGVRNGTWVLHTSPARPERLAVVWVGYGRFVVLSPNRIDPKG